MTLFVRLIGFILALGGAWLAWHHIIDTSAFVHMPGGNTLIDGGEVIPTDNAWRYYGLCMTGILATYIGVVLMRYGSFRELRAVLHWRYYRKLDGKLFSTKPSDSLREQA